MSASETRAERAYVALGANLGNARATLLSARERLAVHPRCQLVACSRLYRTPPLGPPGQPDYLNAVLALETDLAPIALLALLQAIENRHGRLRTVRWGPRTLDLDLIDHGGRLLETPALRLPHPEAHRRQFVLAPLCEIAPDWHHPRMGMTARELLDALLAAGETPLPVGQPW
ncbi:MAG: 2-amino-4-hydroxy-6-hydroxymethyldihydropteridine diphosphokinase [Mariprofundaceae bacterium]